MEAEESSKACSKNLTEVKSKDTDEDNEESKKKEKEDKHSSLVQITASNAEISRRIAALIDRKRCEVDENNRREFCGVHPSLEDDEDGCARTKAVFIPRADGKSHIKVTRVINMYGPQTRALGTGRADTSPYKMGIKQEAGMTDGVEERLANMEEHLKMNAGSLKKDVYTRLKQLEDRILFLEGLSPEYFTSGPPTPKKMRKDSRSAVPASIPQDMSIEELQDRMKLLKETLLRKAT